LKLESEILSWQKEGQKEFIQMTGELNVRELIVKDLKTYQGEVERAIREYHGMKLGEINAILADTWKVRD
jgi:hypothetical protein